mmetsp:Transcript_105662/g.315597  ORF Transcript_105662/g.315597 Transcript_105662/m.315597 type:complete len:237 (-) Transcript_105662:998-1708(-)
MPLLRRGLRLWCWLAVGSRAASLLRRPPCNGQPQAARGEVRTGTRLLWAPARQGGRPQVRRKARTRGGRSVLLRRRCSLIIGRAFHLGQVHERAGHGCSNAIILQQFHHVRLLPPLGLRLQTGNEPPHPLSSVGHGVLAEPVPVGHQPQALEGRPRRQQVEQVLDDEDAAVVAVGLLWHVRNDSLEHARALLDPSRLPVFQAALGGHAVWVTLAPLAPEVASQEIGGKTLWRRINR